MVILFAWYSRVASRGREKVIWQQNLISRRRLTELCMKGKGPRLERETVINFNEVESTASIWTASRPMYRKLKKLGFQPEEDNERSATFKIPKRCVSIRKPVILSDAQIKARQKAGKALAKARF